TRLAIHAPFPYTTLFRSLTLVDHDVVAQHADRILPPHVAVDHHAARDVAELRRAEHLAHLGETDDLLANLGLEHAGERRSDVVRSEEHTSELQSRENLVC